MSNAIDSKGRLIYAESFLVRLTESDKHRLDAIAKKWEVNRTAVIRRIIREAFAREALKVQPKEEGRK